MATVGVTSEVTVQVRSKGSSVGAKATAVGPLQEKKSGSILTSVTVPGFWDAFPRLATAQWLTLRNDEEEGLTEQIQTEVTNLGLILALFTTMFLPLYYGEVGRITVEDDGFTLDVINGILQPLVVTKTFIHEWMDITYCGSLICGALGTVAAVFMSIAVNECGGDAGTQTLLRKVGLLLYTPYYLFSLSVVLFAAGVWFHFFLVPRTVLGLIIKITVAVLTVVHFMAFLSFLVQGVYQAKYNEETNPPKVIAEAELDGRVDDYFRKQQHTGGHSLKEFLKELCPPTETGYRAPLDSVTKAYAVTAYYRALAVRFNVPLEVMLQLRGDLE